MAHGRYDVLFSIGPFWKWKRNFTRSGCPKFLNLLGPALKTGLSGPVEPIEIVSLKVSFPTLIGYSVMGLDLVEITERRWQASMTSVGSDCLLQHRATSDCENNYNDVTASTAL